MTTDTAPITDMDAQHKVIGQLVSNYNAAMAGALVYIGDHNGPSVALHGAGAVTTDELADRLRGGGAAGDYRRVRRACCSRARIKRSRAGAPQPADSSLPGAGRGGGPGSRGRRNRYRPSDGGSADGKSDGGAARDPVRGSGLLRRAIERDSGGRP